MKKALFIDRDGTLIFEPPSDYQVDSLEKLEFMPGVFRNLHLFRKNFDYELIIVSNQDGLGTASYPKEKFNLVQTKMLKAFENEGILFDKVHLDKSVEADNLPTRKPGTGMLTRYMEGDYDLANSYVIGDRITDIELAKNLGAKGILIGVADQLQDIEKQELQDFCELIAKDWDEIYAFIARGNRSAKVERKTGETDIKLMVNLDGNGKTDISTGLHFFDHMLDQIGKHSGCDLTIKVKGDLEVDEHHTIEDTAIALGEAFLKALGDKKGIDRYGFLLPMDDSLAQVAIDFGGRPWLVWDGEFKREKVGDGRPWLVWDGEFKREKVGDVPTEMFIHFFKSFSDAAKCNLNIAFKGDNDHHKIEAVFKGFAKSIKMAKNKDLFNQHLPTTKGLL